MAFRAGSPYLILNFTVFAPLKLPLPFTVIVVGSVGSVGWHGPINLHDGIVVSCCIEQGGGAVAAGPVGAAVLGACVSADRGDLEEVQPIAGSSGQSVAVSTTSSARTD